MVPAQEFLELWWGETFSGLGDGHLAGLGPDSCAEGEVAALGASVAAFSAFQDGSRRGQSADQRGPTRDGYSRAREGPGLTQTSVDRDVTLGDREWMTTRWPFFVT